MPNRDTAPIGSPCWADLWTSDVDGSRRFYSELFGWEAQAPSPEFGGYFMFTREGVPVAGGMGDMGDDMPADNTWKIYLATDDVAKTVESAESSGARDHRSADGRRRPRDPSGPDRSDRCPRRRVGSRGPFRDSRCSTSRARRAGSSCTPAITPLRSRSTSRSSTWDPVAVGDTDEFRYTMMRTRCG